ncbi:hypothetical protein Efla_006174 [Eimeria flavescens]
MRLLVPWLLALVAASVPSGLAAAAHGFSSEAAEPAAFNAVELPARLEAEAIAKEPIRQLKHSMSKQEALVRSSLFLSQITILLLVITVVVLYIQCEYMITRAPWRFATRGRPAGLRKRRLAEGNNDLQGYCQRLGDEEEEQEEEGAVGGEEPTQEGSHSGAEQRSVVALVSRQLHLLEVAEADTLKLKPEELADIHQARKALQDALRNREALERRLVRMERDLSELREKVKASHPGPKAAVRATLEDLERRKADYEKRLKAEDAQLRAMCLDPTQEARTALKLLVSHKKREMSQGMAAALAAAERVNAPGKSLRHVASHLEGVEIIRHAREVMNELDATKQQILTTSGPARLRTLTALARPVELRLAEARRLVRQLRLVAMRETARELAESAQSLEEVARSSGIFPTVTPSAELAGQLEGLTLDEHEARAATEKAVKALVLHERDLLELSGNAQEACSRQPTSDADWMNIHRLFVNAAGVYAVASGHEVPACVPDVKKARFQKALEMCRKNLIWLNGKLAPWWLQKTQLATRRIVAAHGTLRLNSDNFVSALPTPTGPPIMGPLERCKVRFDQAREWAQEIRPLVQGLSWTRNVLGPAFTDLEMRLAEAKTMMARAGELQASSWVSLLEGERRRFETARPRPAEELKFDYWVTLATQDLSSLRHTMGFSLEFNALEDEIVRCRAFLDDLRRQQQAASSRRGTAQKQRKNALEARGPWTEGEAEEAALAPSAATPPPCWLSAFGSSRLPVVSAW